MTATTTIERDSPSPPVSNFHRRYDELKELGADVARLAEARATFHKTCASDLMRLPAASQRSYPITGDSRHHLTWAAIYEAVCSVWWEGWPKTDEVLAFLVDCYEDGSRVHAETDCVYIELPMSLTARLSAPTLTADAATTLPKVLATAFRFIKDEPIGRMVAEFCKEQAAGRERAENSGRKSFAGPSQWPLSEKCGNSEIKGGEHATSTN